MESRLTLSKVKKHPLYANRSPESQQSLAEELIDPAKVKARFAHLLNVDQYVSSIKESDECELTHSLEFDKRREQQKIDAAMATYLPVKLLLAKLRRGAPPAANRFTTLLRFEFGPLHAGLVVGDMCIEWDDSSLVVPMPVPDNPGDFQAHVDSGASWQDGARQVVKDMSIANRQGMETPEKLGIIYNYRDQKERLVDDLVDLIVEYNKSKKYALFRCNCQDFVKDALRALRFRKRALKFTGNLGNYFESLKRGVAADHEFDTHSQLDEYVKANIRTLEKRDKEYLLCLYFQFHSAECKLLSPEEMDEWVCPVQSCKCEELDYQIDQEALFLHARPPIPGGGPAQSVHGPSPSLDAAPTSPPYRISAMPTVESISEEATGTNEENEESTDSLLKQFNGHSVEKQLERLSKWSGYSKQVLAKLQGHPKYRNKSTESLTNVLSEREEFRRAYFSSYIDDMSTEIVLEASSESGNLSPQELRRRASERYDKLFNVDMNLIIRVPTIRDSAAKAPVVVALQVGEYVFEWNETSLVVPLEYKTIEKEPLLLSPVLPGSDWCGVVDEVKENTRKSIDDTVEKGDYSMQIQLHFNLTQKKDELLYAFIDTVLDFNRHKCYSRWRCNNQHFLTAAMKSLGVRKPPKLSVSIADHIHRLSPSKAISRKQIRNHLELDAVVSEVINNDLSREDIEFLIAKYFLFHVTGWEGEGDAVMVADKWECSIPGCKQQHLTKELGKKTSISSDN